MPAPPLTNTLEGGTNGVEITSANSGGGSGDAFSTTTEGVEGSPFFNSTQKRDALSMRINYASAPAATLFAQFGGLGSITTAVYFRAYLFLPATPGNNNFYPFGVRTSADASSAILRILSTGSGGFIQGRDASNSNLGDGAVAVALNQWVRIEFRVVSSTTVGEFEWRLYNTADSSSITDSLSSTGAVLGANTDRINIGCNVTAPVQPFTVYYDDLAVSTTGWIGPSAAPVSSATSKNLMVLGVG